MYEKRFGSIDGRSLHLRWDVPWQFRRYDGGGHRFAPWRLLDPRRWWRSVFNRHCYLWSVYGHRNCNGRCWCPVGEICNANIHFAGWIIQWFYSHYTGEVPCCCDRAIEAMSDKQDETEEF